MSLRSKILLKAAIDYVVVVATAPIWLAVVAVIAAVIKINEPGESIFFKQKRKSVNYSGLQDLTSCRSFLTFLDLK